MFDLNDEIQEWRKQLSGTGACYSKDIEELEAHLREETDHLQAEGLTQEESFLVARNRLGETGTLGREFSKVNPWATWRFRIFWMAVGITAMNLLGIVFSLLNLLGVATIQTLHISTAYLGYWAVVSKMASFGLGLFILWFMVRRKSRKQITQGMEAKGRPLSRMLVVTIFICLAGGGVVISGLCHMGTYRLISPQELNSFAMMNAWFTSLVSILFNLLLAGLIVYLYPRSFGTGKTS